MFYPPVIKHGNEQFISCSGFPYFQGPFVKDVPLPTLDFQNFFWVDRFKPPDLADRLRAWNEAAAARGGAVAKATLEKGEAETSGGPRKVG